MSIKIQDFPEQSLEFKQDPRMGENLEFEQDSRLYLYSKECQFKIVNSELKSYFKYISSSTNISYTDKRAY